MLTDLALTLAAVTLLLVAVTVFGAAHLAQLRAWLRGRRVVTCPETGSEATVKLDVGYSAVRSAFGRPHFRVEQCTRWPDHARCGQTCLTDLEALPDSFPGEPGRPMPPVM